MNVFLKGRKQTLSLFNFNQSTKHFFSTSFGFKYPDIIIAELKQSLEKEAPILDLEDDIINNLHFFDCEQYTDLLTLLGSKSRGSSDLWHFIQKKAHDYELDFIQVRDIYNTNCLNPKASNILSFWLNKNIAKEAGLKTDEKETYQLLH
jgi:hypothetical protein